MILPSRTATRARGRAVATGKRLQRGGGQCRPSSSRPRAEGVRILRGDGQVQPCLIPFCHVLFRRQHTVGKVAVVGEDEQALGVLVQSSGGKQPPALQLRGQQVDDGFAVRIPEADKTPAGLCIIR